MKIIMIMLIGLCSLSHATDVSKKYKTVHVRSTLATAGLALAGIKAELKDRPSTPPATPEKELSIKYLQRRARLMEPLTSTSPLRYSSRSTQASKGTLTIRSSATTE